ncbi:insulinase family protein [Neptuniibacter caesariensis]|uniref:Peptidase M16-like n=1 Tax=Neptuniibacter caesariensis TaxID=207954 RepID=A0A7U8C107_NEPCE|nr:insulinase family protein [Neptuniibacter caesariensis]EAR59538.1 Peptidase M16-like [Oceanospirillum sp. MED92] [Neptuniibacter caesariensis]
MTNLQTVADCHASFDFVRSEKIESLGIDVAEFTHKETGLTHYHIAADHSENVFLVGLRTVPEDSKGVAHILEHTALCGSERFPVRDPFFMMTRRSLNTFMNAMTSSDWTSYPFASQNRKDFFNLLDVYLDAVFFSRLDPLDFEQEGHRVEFAEPGNPDSDLEYKGVVFNEMKGAMSSPVSRLWQSVTKYLFPTTTYHHNSGGEPECIPDLSYDELIDFYKTHYHPSNAVIMTFGDIPATELQTFIEEKALARFEKLDTTIDIHDEKRYHSPLRVEEGYDLDQEDLSGKTHHVMAWLMGPSSDLEAQLKAHLMSRVLLDNSAAPLRHALESTDLGSAPSPLCGLEDSNREMSFMCGIEGSEPESADAFEKMVLEVLEKVAEEGVPQKMLEAQLHQLELQQREINGDGYPYGLSLIMSSLGAAVNHGDPIALLNLDPVLEKLREEIKQPDYVQNLVRELLDNPHRVRLTLRPDNQLAARRDAAEKAQLAKIKASLNEDEKQALISRAAELEARQNQIDDESILPKVTLNDVPDDMTVPEPTAVNSSLPYTRYDRGTNGLIYQQIIMQLPELSEDEQHLLPLYSYLLTELGCGERSYQENQQYQTEVTGGVHAFASIRGMPDNEQDVRGFFTLSGKALISKQQELLDLLKETLDSARFDELSRIREVVSQQRTRKEQSITGSGHALAMMAASAKMSPAAALAQATKGLESIRFFKTLDEQLEDQAQLQALSDKLANLHSKIQKTPRQFLVVAEEEYQAGLQQALESLWQGTSETEGAGFKLPALRERVKQAWTTSTQVSFCAKSFPTVPVEHPDSAALTILGDFLRNGFLHRAIREKGGAYGSGAGQDSGDAAFRFFSYRDPRLTETLDDFDASIQWLLENEHEDQKLEEAILGVVSSIDKPGSPAGEAKQAFHSLLFGRSPEQRKAFRSRILQVTLDDLKRVAKTYLLDADASVAVVTSKEQADELGDAYEIIEV